MIIFRTVCQLIKLHFPVYGFAGTVLEWNRERSLPILLPLER
ncbi:hypothetical protein [Leptolyngbya sp. FACHB-17]|nr:hypothetical protein [Leptolyngbya sp. FACHB-17]